MNCDSISRKCDFDNLKKNGKKIKIADFAFVSFLSNPDFGVRCAWTIPKYCGTAVLRNRLKRLCRAAVREAPEFFNNNVDINIVFKRAEPHFYREMKLNELKKYLYPVFERIKRSI